MDDFIKFLNFIWPGLVVAIYEYKQQELAQAIKEKEAKALELKNLEDQNKIRAEYAHSFDADVVRAIIGTDKPQPKSDPKSKSG